MVRQDSIVTCWTGMTLRQVEPARDTRRASRAASSPTRLSNSTRKARALNPLRPAGRPGNCLTESRQTELGFHSALGVMQDWHDACFAILAKPRRLHAGADAENAACQLNRNPARLRRSPRRSPSL